MRIRLRPWLVSVPLICACADSVPEGPDPAASSYVRQESTWDARAPGSDGGSASAGPRPWVLGHRGLASSHPDNPWPENTLASAVRALEIGADGLEIDLVKTADDVLVMYHDRTLHPPESQPRKVDCDGNLTQLTWAEVAHCQVLPGEPGAAPQPLSTLDELLELGEMKLLLLDIKNDLFDFESPGEAYGDYDAARTLEVLQEVLAAHGYPGYVVLGLYQDTSRERAQELGLTSCLKYHGHLDWSADVMLEKIDAVDGWGVCMNHSVFDHAFTLGLHERDAWSLAYINSATIERDVLRNEMGRLLALGVDVLLTDRVGLALELRRELSGP